jgi:hypothetical protein
MGGKRWRRSGHDDRGQVLPLVAALVALCGAALVGLVPLARALDERAQARTAADAAALAGAADGEVAARRIAAANDAELMDIDIAGAEVTVRVRVGAVEAYARARSIHHPSLPDVARPASGDGGSRAGLAPVMLAALSRADRMLGRPVTVVSGLRTHAQQQLLWERRAANPYPVAPPGTSDHERGLAVDVPRSEVDDLLGVASAAGLCQPLPVTDPVHFVVCGA